MSNLEPATTIDLVSDVAIERHFDATRLNAIVNHPEVLPWVRGPIDGELDLSAVAEDPSNVVLVGDLGAMVFTPLRTAIWEVHTQVLPEGRGTWARSFVESSLRWMFTNTDVIELMTRCPEGNVGALALARAIGGRPAFRLDNGWVYDGKTVPATVFSLTLQDWLARHAKDFTSDGEEFNEELRVQYASFGREIDVAANDDSHNAALGVAIAMFLGGQPYKAATFYNRWAAFAGYAPIAVLQVEPTLLVDIHEAILWIRPDGEFEVVKLTTMVN